MEEGNGIGHVRGTHSARGKPQARRVRRKLLHLTQLLLSHRVLKAAQGRSRRPA